MSVLQTCSSDSVFFDYPVFLSFHVNFTVSLYVFKMAHWSFDWDCYESVDHLGRIHILTLLSLPIHERGIFFPFF